jgi:hypothetical protein
MNHAEDAGNGGNSQRHRNRGQNGRGCIFSKHPKTESDIGEQIRHYSYLQATIGEDISVGGR